MKKLIVLLGLLFGNVAFADTPDASTQVSKLPEASEIAASQGLELDPFQLDAAAKPDTVCLSAFCTPIQTCWWSFDDTASADVDEHVGGIRVACDYSLPYGDSVCRQGCGAGSFCNTTVGHIWLTLEETIGQCINQYCPWPDPCTDAITQVNVGTCVVWRMTGRVETCAGPSGPPDGGPGGTP